MLRTQADAEEHLRESDGLVQFKSGSISWETEMLVGAVITGSGCSFEVVPLLVFMSHLSRSVDVYVDAGQTAGCEKAWAQPVWLALEDIPQDYSIGFTLSYSVN
ncbi:MAG: hypothetical protein H8E48_01385 [Chloroflexi bacterium]|nr:hypothetical protein [Chloroflexota bacterium]